MCKGKTDKHEVYVLILMDGLIIHQIFTCNRMGRENCYFSKENVNIAKTLMPAELRSSSFMIHESQFASLI